MPKIESSASSGTTTYGVRSRSSSRLETTKPIAPPACWRFSLSPSSGRGLPLAMCTMPSTPNARAAQPMTWRPAGPLCSGSRRLRHPTYTSSSGTNQPTLPTEPATTVRVASMTEPGSCHQTAAAATTARPKRNRPAPSRRCSGSRSRAVCPIERAVAPRAWAMPSQTAATPLPRAAKSRASGPGPLRTARGAGREPRVGLRFDVVGFRLAWLPVLRDRVLEPARDERAPGRALAPRPRRGRRTGRHAQDSRRSSHLSQGPHGACRRASRPGLSRGRSGSAYTRTGGRKNRRQFVTRKE